MNYITKERREAYVEVLEILENMDTYYKEKIPLNVIKYFKNNASEEYKFHINLLRPLDEQKLKNTTKNVLAMINLKYWCETEEEKQKWKKIYAKNEIKHEEELREKYDLDNIFENRKKSSLEKYKENIVKQEISNVEIVEYEESLLKKIINRIKSFFKKY